MKNFSLTLSEGGVFDVYKDGCSVVSIFNMLKLNGYLESFDFFADSLMKYKCMESGGINWVVFNNLQNILRFTWMQDNEFLKCEQVRITRLSDWVSSGASALVKLQSTHGIDRRHFMMTLGVQADYVTCLESSDISGVPKLRDVKSDQILGVRYFELV